VCGHGCLRSPFARGSAARIAGERETRRNPLNFNPLKSSAESAQSAVRTSAFIRCNPPPLTV
jgi:hypothetical protein